LFTTPLFMTTTYGGETVIIGVIVLYFIVVYGKWVTFYLGPLTSHNFSHWH